MYTIIIFGNKKSNQLKDILKANISPNFNINYISDSLCSDENDKQNINLIETSNLEDISIKNAILIIKDNANISAIKQIDKSTNVIVSSHDKKSIIKLSKTLSKIYSCGFSSKDYITFSSREENKAVVSLQRSITQLNGDICEPLEIPCYFDEKICDYAILSSILCSILLNIIE